jgi:hypothetical protein
MKCFLGAAAIAAAALTLPATAPADDSARVGDLLPVPSVHNSHVTDAEIVSSLGLLPGHVGAIDDFTTNHACFDVIETGHSGFPTQGSNYFALGSGATAFIGNANDSDSTSSSCAGLATNAGQDLTSISFALNVPSGATAVKFDWKFFSEEFPEFVNTPYNDAFIVEHTGSTFQIVGNDVQAPRNIAFDSNNNLISINSTGNYGMSLANAAGTTYDGATPTLATTHTFAAGTSGITLVFSAMDLGDSIYDTMVFVDNVRFTNDTGDTVTVPAEICNDGIDNDLDLLVDTMDPDCPSNTPPTVDGNGPYSVAEGGSVSLDATGTDAEGGLTYAWDLDNDATYETPGEMAMFSAALLDGPSSHTVGVQVTDSGGLTATDTATVGVTNVVPTLSLTPNAATACGAASGVVLTIGDPGVPDTHSYAIDWGDGALEGGVATNGMTLSHTYASAATYAVTVTVTDDDAGASDAAATSLVTNYTVVDNTFRQPINPGHPTSIFKYGSTIPAKLIVLDCDGSVADGLDIRVFWVQLSSGSPIAGEIEASSTSAADTGNQMRLTSDGTQYIFNLATNAITTDPTSTWRIIARIVATGQIVTADVGLKK